MSAVVRRETEVKPRTVLEFQTSLLAVALSVHHHKRSQESNHFKISAQFLSVPDLAMLAFLCFSPAGPDVDFCDALAEVGLVSSGLFYLLGLVAEETYS